MVYLNFRTALFVGAVLVQGHKCLQFGLVDSLIKLIGSVRDLLLLEGRLLQQRHVRRPSCQSRGLLTGVTKSFYRFRLGK